MNTIELTRSIAERTLKGDFPSTSIERKRIVIDKPELYGLARQLYPKEFPDRRAPWKQETSK